MRNTLFLAFALIVGPQLVGCGGGSSDNPGMPKQATVSVSGILTYKGKAVPDASVTLQSLDGKIASRGKTDKAGTFTLTTYSAQDGAPPGKYKVMAATSGVTEIEPGVLAPEPPGGFKSLIPTKYANPATTDVIVEVKEQGKNELVIDLK
jgi:hypothetical protein